MIATVTLNPAIDLYFETDGIEFDQVLVSEQATRSAGGKGINVSRMLHELGTSTRAFVLIGGDAGQELVGLGKRGGFDIQYVNTEVHTRINVVIHDRQSGKRIKINSPGGETDERYLATFKRMIERYIAGMSAIVLAGSAPPGFGHGAYADLIRMSHRLGLPVFLDAKGDLLASAMAENPTVVKINREELEGVLQRPVRTPKEIVAAARPYIDAGIRMVVITTDREGAILVEADQAFLCRPPEVFDVEAVGAGDCFMAGVVHQYAEGRRGAELLAFATACGTACAKTAEDTLGPKNEVEALLKKTKVERVG
ncbi:hexose kinase [bacterium]|nr:hexose kinase [bacterium]